MTNVKTLKKIVRSKKGKTIGRNKFAKRQANKSKKGMALKNYDQRISVSEQNPRTKMIIDFDYSLSCSIKVRA